MELQLRRRVSRGDSFRRERLASTHARNVTRKQGNKAR
jgi:hypothetical protein